ncbi:MAG: hypothetical protein KJ578_13275 [Bacteroidetes bacterium]|nr:hypothetical protein [Bacteroidota bacterium]
MMNLNKSSIRVLGIFTCLFLINLAVYAGISGEENDLIDKQPVINSKSDWQTMIDNDYVSTQYRWLNLSNGNRVIERKARMLLTGVSARSVAEVIRNYKLIPAWMNAVNETKLILRDGRNYWVIFFVFKLPWPLRNKYLINEVIEQKHPVLPLYLFKIQSTNQYQPPYDCEVNDFGHYEGLWKVYALSNALTYVEFSSFSTAPPQFPRWIQDPIVNKVFTKTMVNFFHLVNEKK